MRNNLFVINNVVCHFNIQILVKNVRNIIGDSYRRTTPPVKPKIHIITITNEPTRIVFNNGNPTFNVTQDGRSNVVGDNSIMSYESFSKKNNLIVILIEIIPTLLKF